MSLEPIDRAASLLFLEVCQGRAGDLEPHLRRLLDAGASAALVDELLLLSLPYAGVPRALLAFGAWRKLEPRPHAEASPPIDRRQAGADAFAYVYPAADRIRSDLRALHPTFEAAVIEDHYGRILSRGTLAWRIKELIALPVLVALDALPQAAAHARAARRSGVTDAALHEAMLLAAPYVAEQRLAAAIARVERLIRGARAPD